MMFIMSDYVAVQGKNYNRASTRQSGHHLFSILKPITDGKCLRSVHSAHLQQAASHPHHLRHGTVENRVLQHCGSAADVGSNKER